jgi:hypothetical protein
MDIGFDQNEWRAAPVVREIAGVTSHAPEWLALHSRLCAAWSARQEMAASVRGSTARLGSFDRVSATTLAQFDYASHAVNPVALGNLKPGEGNAGSRTGDSTPGGRG